jgi:hypothetical protein
LGLFMTVFPDDIMLLCCHDNVIMLSW